MIRILCTFHLVSLRSRRKKKNSIIEIIMRHRKYYVKEIVRRIYLFGTMKPFFLYLLNFIWDIWMRSAYSVESTIQISSFSGILVIEAPCYSFVEMVDKSWKHSQKSIWKQNPSSWIHWVPFLNWLKAHTHSKVLLLIFFFSRYSKIIHNKKPHFVYESSHLLILQHIMHGRYLKIIFKID